MAATTKEWVVQISAKFPAAGDSREPDLWECRAKDRNDAIKQARREMSHRGYTRHDGGFNYRATVKREA